MEPGDQFIHALAHRVGHAGETEPDQFRGLPRHAVFVQFTEGDAQHAQRIAGHAVVLGQNGIPGLVGQAHAPAVADLLLAHCQHFRGAALDRKQILAAFPGV